MIRKLWDKYHRGLMASAVAIFGGYEPLQNIYTHLTNALELSGLDWPTVISIITGSGSGFMPYAAIIAVVYYKMTKGKQVDPEKLTAEIIAILKKRQEL